MNVQEIMRRIDFIAPTYFNGVYCAEVNPFSAPKLYIFQIGKFLFYKLRSEDSLTLSSCNLPISFEIFLSEREEEIKKGVVKIVTYMDIVAYRSGIHKGDIKVESKVNTLMLECMGNKAAEFLHEHLKTLMHKVLYLETQ